LQCLLLENWHDIVSLLVHLPVSICIFMSLLCLKKLLWLEHLYIVFDLLGMIVNSEDEAYVYATRIGFSIPTKKKKKKKKIFKRCYTTTS
jgi:hypothetical protein